MSHARGCYDGPRARARAAAFPVWIPGLSRDNQAILTGFSPAINKRSYLFGHHGNKLRLATPVESITRMFSS